MKTPAQTAVAPRNFGPLVLIVAGLAGFCTMSYEVLWFRVLRYFVDNSIFSFAIILTTFLFGLMIGGFVLSRFIDAGKGNFRLLGIFEICIGLLCIVSIPLIAQANGLIVWLNTVLGTSWNSEVATRFLVFSCVMLLPTALMGGAFPLMARIHAEKTGSLGMKLGEVYGSNTIGGVVGSFAGGFVLVPLLGVQNGVCAISCVNLLIGGVCLFASPSGNPKRRIVFSAVAVVAAAVLYFAIPHNAFLKIYTNRYPLPQSRLVYLKEDMNGTTAVFQDVKREWMKYMLIDNTGEVSTDYFSMRAFRFLGILPALYCPQAKNALIVTFGSGIVAGTVAGLPGMESVDCVEICKEAFNAARNFSNENHDVLNNPRIRFVVNDGRNYVLTTDKKFDIISADATHPTSSDSWVLYTKEFYRLCSAKLRDNGVMCQWIPLHGVLERDYKIILRTFHSVFPFVSVYYSGGTKTSGHTLLLGSKSPMKVDFSRAEKLLDDSRVREDLTRVNVLSVYDLFNGLLMDQDAIDRFTAGVPCNTDDKPCIVFSKFELENRPYQGIAPLAGFRKNIFPSIINVDTAMAAQVKQTIDQTFEATGLSLEAQVLENREYTMRMTQNFDKSSREQMVRNLYASKALFDQVLAKYNESQEKNPNDLHTRYLFNTFSSEYEYLNSFLESLQAGH
jgi:spermidine synthase